MRVYQSHTQRRAARRLPPWRLVAAPATDKHSAVGVGLYEVAEQVELGWQPVTISSGCTAVLSVVPCAAPAVKRNDEDSRGTQPAARSNHTAGGGQ